MSFHEYNSLKLVMIFTILSTTEMFLHHRDGDTAQKIAEVNILLGDFFNNLFSISRRVRTCKTPPDC